MNGAPFADNYSGIDFRLHPEQYRIGRGEQGVLTAEPYKSEILPHWRFKTPDIAEESAAHIFGMFQDYGKQNDFVGMDMARKFLQMGYTRSRRYANHSGGKKYDGPVPADKKGQSGAHGRDELARSPEDSVKAASAAVFKGYWDKARQNKRYLELKARHKLLS